MTVDSHDNHFQAHKYYDKANHVVIDPHSDK